MRGEDKGGRGGGEDKRKVVMQAEGEFLTAMQAVRGEDRGGQGRTPSLPLSLPPCPPPPTSDPPPCAPPAPICHLQALKALWEPSRYTYALGGGVTSRPGPGSLDALGGIRLGAAAAAIDIVGGGGAGDGLMAEFSLGGAGGGGSQRETEKAGARKRGRGAVAVVAVDATRRDDEEGQVQAEPDASDEEQQQRRPVRSGRRPGGQSSSMMEVDEPSECDNGDGGDPGSAPDSQLAGGGGGTKRVGRMAPKAAGERPLRQRTLGWERALPPQEVGQEISVVGIDGGAAAMRPMEGREVAALADVPEGGEPGQEGTAGTAALLASMSPLVGQQGAAGRRAADPDPYQYIRVDPEPAASGGEVGAPASSSPDAAAAACREEASQAEGAAAGQRAGAGAAVRCSPRKAAFLARLMGGAKGRGSRSIAAAAAGRLAGAARAPLDNGQPDTERRADAAIDRSEGVAEEAGGAAAGGDGGGVAEDDVDMQALNALPPARGNSQPEAGELGADPEEQVSEQVSELPPSSGTAPQQQQPPVVFVPRDTTLACDMGRIREATAENVRRALVAKGAASTAAKGAAASGLLASGRFRSASLRVRTGSGGGEVYGENLRTYGEGTSM